MRKSVIGLAAFVFLTASFSAQAQRERRNGQWWNPNYIMGDWDPDNNRYNPIEATTGVNGDNVDGDPRFTASYDGVYGLGNLWSGGWYIARRYVTGGGGSKYSLMYVATTRG